MLMTQIVDSINFCPVLLLLQDYFIIRCVTVIVLMSSMSQIFKLLGNGTSQIALRSDRLARGVAGRGMLESRGMSFLLFSSKEINALGTRWTSLNHLLTIHSIAWLWRLCAMSCFGLWSWSELNSFSCTALERVRCSHFSFGLLHDTNVWRGIL